MPHIGTFIGVSLDVVTLLIVATCVTTLLGVFLLFVGKQDRISALTWWGAAYVTGGLSVVLWTVEDMISPPLPAGFANALFFFSCGMVWNAARRFHGRPILWGGMALGAAIWLLVCALTDVEQSMAGRMILSSLIVAAYTVLTAMELTWERRRAWRRKWPSIFVPMLHGAVFLCPIPLASVLPIEGGLVRLASGWITLFVIEVMLYVVATAFVVLALAKEEMVRIHRDAASTDELTGLPNRRGFLAAAQDLMAHAARSREPVSLLTFDLDHFKSINDRFGHHVGDETLSLFAGVASANLRASDVLGRFGGEEFVALLPGTLEEAATAAERVRAAFEAAAVSVAGRTVHGTVSIGAASGPATAEVASLLIQSDAALYRAKANGRNRIEMARDEMPLIFTTATNPHHEPLVGGILEWTVERHAPACRPALAA